MIDDWYALVGDSLGGSRAGRWGTPDSDELDRVLSDAFLALSESHLIVVTSGRSSVLQVAADAVVDVRKRRADPRAVEVRFVRDPLGETPGDVHVLRSREDGNWS